ncbi:MAG TPA: RagB/SusD family nutrient uptake outer membrane protein [Parasegetibacter sp.]
MKSSKYIMMCLVTGSLFMTSCKKWLTVQPSTEVTQNVLFDNESGFKDALNGVYMLLKSNDLYGNHMTYGTIDRLVSNWDFTAGTVENAISLMDFTHSGVQEQFSRIFAQQYKTIANVNQILKYLETNKHVFRTTNLHDYIKSECLAIRAFCHFDLLRLFGPVPGNIPSGTVLPYVKTLSIEPNRHETYEVFKNHLMQDLTDAENLVKDIEPFINYSAVQLAAPSDPRVSDFNPETEVGAYRFIRFNYYAIKGLQARAWLWFGDKGQAYQAAKVILDAKNSNGASKFPLGTPSSYQNNDMNLSSEHILGLYDHNLRSKYDGQFASGNIKKGTSSAIVVTQLYGNTGTDMRETSLWTTVQNGSGIQSYIIRKFATTTSVSAHNLGRFMMPIIRISEMYLIAAEAAPDAEKAQYWNAYRVARNLNSAVIPASEAEFRKELAKEYHREFIAEGQAFFAYKRVNAAKADMIWPQAAAEVNYVVPLPLNEFYQ